MTRLFFALLSLAFLPAAQAQTAPNPMQPIRTFFEGMARADTALIRSSLHSLANFQTLRRSGQIGQENITGFLTQIAAAKPGELDERLGQPTVVADSPLAQVSTPYEFHYKGKYSHGGVNFFTLAVEDGQYKILYVVDTRRPGYRLPKS